MTSPADQNKPAQIVSRREFFKHLGAGLAAAAFAALDPARVMQTGGVVSAAPASQSQAWFSAHVGDKFVVRNGSSGRMTFKLLRVEQGITKVSQSRRGKASVARGECFLLVFQGPRSPVLPERIYQFAHSQIGKFPLFILSGTANKDGQRYTAVINHVHTTRTA